MSVPTTPGSPESPPPSRLAQSKAFRRVVALLAVTLALTGVGFLVYPFATDVWAGVKQTRMEQQFADPGFRAAYRHGNIQEGQGVTRLRIPKLGVDVMVAEGTSEKSLSTGAGHYADTPLPGQKGNVGIAGHRTTWGHPFRHLERMRQGDHVILQTPFATYTYTIAPPFEGHDNPWAVAPTTYPVVGDQPVGHWLTLTTCDPPGSAQRRLVLRLELTKTKWTSGRTS